jgi:hypothetical protein
MDKLAKELHKPIIKKYQRRRVVVKEIDEIWGADLVDMGFCKDKNDDYRYILTVIDCFSKYAWAVALKNKDAQTVTDAFMKIFEGGRICQKAWVDMGSEFYNSTLKKLFLKLNVEMYSTFGDHKSAVIERFNRTLKEKMWEKFTANNTRKWIDILQSLISTYNKSEHSAIKMTPIQASQDERENDVLFNLENKKPIKVADPKLSIGDYVRIARIKGQFEKGSEPNWTREIFKVSKILETKPVTYEITEYDDSPIQGAFYEQELQKTDGKNAFLVEEVLKTRTVNKKKEFFVKYLGWDKKYNKWVSKKDIENSMK